MLQNNKKRPHNVNNIELETTNTLNQYFILTICLHEHELHVSSLGHFLLEN